MPVAVNIVSYNRANLQKWKLELQTSKEERSFNLNLIEEQNKFLRTFEQNLEQKNLRISSVQWQLSSLQTSAVIDNFDHYHAHHPFHSNYHYHGEGILHMVGDGLRAWNIRGLQIELTQLELERAQIIENMKPYQRAVTEANKNLRELKARTNWLGEHILAAEKFLGQLHINPAQLVTELKERLIQTINEYEAEHFSKLSPQVRISLLNFHLGLNSLLIDSNDSKVQQQNYLRLCGFLHDRHSQVIKEGQDAIFCDRLAKIINHTHVGLTEDLPDEFATGYTANAWYQVRKEQLSVAFAITEQNLSEVEHYYYSQAMNYLLHPHLQSHTHLQKKVIKAAQTLSYEVAAKSLKNEEIDYHFYTCIAQSLIQVYNKPNDLAATKRLFTLAESASGASLIGKQLLGGLMVVLGALLIAASVTGLALTLGSSSILSVWGIALGLTLVEMQIAIGVSSCITAAVGAGVTFWGRNTINSGMRQGFSQELVDVQEEADNPTGYDAPPPYNSIYNTGY